MAERLTLVPRVREV